ncbi:MAG TPA: 4-hydroxythreonine-4-phosphate dehydrogenase PdxA [Gemmatimonadales bacterium]|nr:4-hydroxythreonine-4-phosphate dehydrogenase PdxA [Gemmatimonadales bacterium]
MLVGPDDLLAKIPARSRLGVGEWGFGRGHSGDPEQELAAGRLAARSIERAVWLARAGEVDAVVTAPVHKGALHRAGYRYPGVTEFLGALTGGTETVMMLVTGALRVALVTTHLPLREALGQITTDRVVRVGETVLAALKDRFEIPSPKLALCALNPHAGEGGLFGDEDQRILAPAAQRLGARGPFPADTVFVRGLKGEFDAVLAPYHDVGMTAVKVAGFGRGVNVTLGLPFVRTSPDHGTAFDIAGTGKADSGSMRAAIELAAQMARRR